MKGGSARNNFPRMMPAKNCSYWNSGYKGNNLKSYLI
jgi:hypothetical protein